MIFATFVFQNLEMHGLGICILIRSWKLGCYIISSNIVVENWLSTYKNVDASSMANI